MAIDPISARALASVVQKPGASASPDAAAPGGTPSFTDSLTKLIDSVNDTAGTANTAVNEMVAGTGDVHHAMLALQRSEEMLQLTVQVRNKLMQAYQDVMRMPM
jgi:flagellar hook-basal body complex protein FliE